MKKLLALFVIGAVAAFAGWQYIRQPAVIKNGGYTYHFTVDEARKTKSGTLEAMNITKDTAKGVLVAVPDDIGDVGSCPAIAPSKNRDITVLGVHALLCVSQGGGIALTTFTYGQAEHVLTLTFSSVPDYDIAAKLFESVSVTNGY